MVNLEVATFSNMMYKKEQKKKNSKCLAELKLLATF